MSSLRLAFMGTAAFAVPALDALCAAGHEIVRVYTQPPRPAGRGHKLRPTPVQEAAERLGLAVETPRSLRDADAQAAFAALGCDAAVVAAYGLILPRPVLEAPRLGCVNIHPSLLPRWRGAAPIPRTIEAGDAESGVTIIVMDEGVDTGPVLAVERVAVPPRADAGQLHDMLAALGARLMVATLDGFARGRIVPRPQDEAGATYAAKIDKAETVVDWSRPAETIDRQVRAFSPSPGARFMLGGEAVRLLAAEPADGSGAPGTLLDADFTVACGSGALRLLRVQRPGRAAVSGADFLRGARLAPGARLG